MLNVEEEEKEKEAEIKNEEIGSGHTSMEEVRNKGKGFFYIFKKYLSKYFN